MTTTLRSDESLRAEIARRREEAAAGAAHVAAGHRYVIIEIGTIRLVHAGGQILLQTNACGTWCTDRTVETADRQAVLGLIIDMIDLDECLYDYLVGAGLVEDLEV